MTNNNAMKLLGLIAVFMIPMGAAFAALVTPTAINSITVNSDDSIDLVCTDPTFDAGEAIEGRELLIDNDVAFGSPEVTVGGPADTLSLVCDGLIPNHVSFAGNYADFDSINVRLTVYDDSNADSFADSSFTVADNTNPVVTGSTTNIISGGSTVRTLSDQYAESCIATDNDPAFVDNCAVQSGAIDTSVLGLQSVTYFATDPSGNIGTQTITTTVIAGDSPVITLTGADPQTILLHNAYVELGATASDTEDGDITGSIVIDSSAVDVDTLGSYTVTYDVTDSSGNTDHVERTVDVVTGNPPVITILGDNPANVLKDSAYTDAGATASDVEDVDLTASIITGGAVDTSTVGSYIISYDVTDSNGNTDHKERTVIVSDHPMAVMTSTLSDPTGPTEIPVTVQFNEGVTGFDLSDITVSNGIAKNLVSVDADTYTFTIEPANTNVFVSASIPDGTVQSIATGFGNNPATFSIQVQLKESSGNWCTGDCVPPTIGLDSSGRRMVDWPVIYHTSTVDFRQLAEYFHTPMNDFVVNVGDINTLKFVVYDNSGYDAIRQIGLSIGVPFTGTFNDGAAQLRWYAAVPGQTVGDNTSYTEETDPNNIFELKSFTTERLECNPHATGNENCMGVTIKYVFREAPKDTAIRLDIWDEHLNAFQHVLNEGVTVQGDSLNGPHVFSAMGSNGYMYTLTTDNDFATDQNGDRWSYDGHFWSKDLKPITNEIENLKQANLAKEEQKAKSAFDSSKLQKPGKPVKDYIPERYERLHDPVPNMIKAYIDYAKERAGHS